MSLVIDGNYAINLMTELNTEVCFTKLVLHDCMNNLLRSSNLSSCVSIGNHHRLVLSCIGSYFGTRASTWWSANPWKNLNASIKILYLILDDSSSQCRRFNTGVMWSYFDAPVRIRATGFWIFCSFFSSVAGRLYNKEFVLSSRVITKAWMGFSAASVVKYPRYYGDYILLTCTLHLNEPSVSRAC